MDFVEKTNHLFNWTYHDDIDIATKRLRSVLSIMILINECIENHYNDAHKYIQNRNKVKPKLLQIQEKVMNKITPTLPNDWIMIPSSSFSSDTFLEKDSDIDFTITISNMTINDVSSATSILESNGFKFKEEKCPGKKDNYYVFSAYIDDIEIEIKVRDRHNAKRILIIHDYIDNKYDNKMKPYITYLKYLLKDTSSYTLLKYLIYEYILTLSGWTGELFGCHIQKEQ